MTDADATPEVDEAEADEAPPVRPTRSPCSSTS